MTTFNIQSQSAASINNVGGDMTVNGGIHATAELQGELATLRAEVERLQLAPAQRDEALGHVERAAAEASRPEPDGDRVAGHLKQATEVVQEAGALASGGGALVESLVRLGKLLGPAAGVLLALL